MGSTSLLTDTLARELRYALDPVAFARERLQFTLDPWQADFLRSTAQDILLNCCRQSGKSTVMAILALWIVLYHPKAIVLLVAPTERQSKEILSKIDEFMDKLPNRPALAEDTATGFKLASNGARMVALPDNSDTIRSYSAVSVLILDEAARISNATFVAVSPMRAVSGGRCIMASTGNGKQGFFYDAWDKEEDWHKIAIDATQCPRISKEFLEKERKKLGEAMYQQEYFCAFVEGVGQLFSQEDIDARAHGQGAALEPPRRTV